LPTADQISFAAAIARKDTAAALRISHICVWNERTAGPVFERGERSRFEGE
jgi:hypothetical protein